MVSQFVSSHDVNLIADINFDFPEGTHAIGRLDSNSEGLLLLTTNKKITRLLFQSDKKHTRTYLIQVNNIISQENILRLQTGVSIKIKNGLNYITPPCEVKLVDDPDSLCYFPTGDTEKYGKHSWLQISLTEGKFRQVRKMIAAVNHRCKRLIRISIEDITLKGIAPGEICEVSEEDFFTKLKIKFDKS